MVFISFEGVDGSGKSTQAERLAERLRAAGYDVLRVREPGGTTLGEAVRDILLNPEMPITAMAEMLLFSAARSQLAETVIRPALASGTVVISDRFFDSTTVYQGLARGLGDVQWLRDFHAHVTGGVVPDRTYVLSVPASIASARRRVRNGVASDDRIEAEGEAFLEEVVKGYEALASMEPFRVTVVDGTRTEREIEREIWTDAQACLGRHIGTAS